MDNFIMDNFMKDLDRNLDYLGHKIDGSQIIIYAASNRTACLCPYCGVPSHRIHSYYTKCFQDLPFLGKKTKIVLKNRKLYCSNPDCRYTTFAERFDFLAQHGRKTNRLINKIIEMSLFMNSVQISRLLKNSIADVEKSTVCNLINNRYLSNPPN